MDFVYVARCIVSKTNHHGHVNLWISKKICLNPVTPLDLAIHGELMTGWRSQSVHKIIPCRVIMRPVRLERAVKIVRC